MIEEFSLDKYLLTNLDWNTIVRVSIPTIERFWNHCPNMEWILHSILDYKSVLDYMCAMKLNEFERKESEKTNENWLIISLGKCEIYRWSFVSILCRSIFVDWRCIWRLISLIKCSTCTSIRSRIRTCCCSFMDEKWFTYNENSNWFWREIEFIELMILPLELLSSDLIRLPFIIWPGCTTIW